MIKMPHYFIVLIALMALFIQCEKETTKTPGFRVSLREFSVYTPDKTTDVYCLITREDGSTVATKHFTVQSWYQSMEVEAENASPLEVLDITVFTNASGSNWSAYTWRKIPSGAVLSRRGLVSDVLNGGIGLNFPITDTPPLDTIDIPGTLYDFMAYPSGINFFVQGSVSYATNGFLLRAKPKGQENWLIHWQPETPYNALFNTPIPYSQFKSDYPKRTVTLPYPSENWIYSIAGVVQDTGFGEFTYLAEKNVARPGEPATNTITFDDPAELNARMYSVFAYENAGNASNSYEFLLQPDNLTIPPIDFGVSSATLKPAGNTFRLEITPSGTFDVVTAHLYGNIYFSDWTITGSPGDLTGYTLPVWPSNWPIPAFKGSSSVHTTCDDYQAFSNYQEALVNLKPERLWFAKAGWRRHTGN